MTTLPRLTPYSPDVWRDVLRLAAMSLPYSGWGDCTRSQALGVLWRLEAVFGKGKTHRAQRIAVLCYLFRGDISSTNDLRFNEASAFIAEWNRTPPPVREMEALDVWRCIEAHYETERVERA